jgi:hypothetical protein
MTTLTTTVGRFIKAALASDELMKNSSSHFQNPVARSHTENSVAINIDAMQGMARSASHRK